MSTTAVRSSDKATDAKVGNVDMKLEVVTLPVSDLDRAKEFYGASGGGATRTSAMAPGARSPGQLTYGSYATFSARTATAGCCRRSRHGSRGGWRDANWPDWYAAYMMAERAGTEPPT